jgi:prophage DNA circulation protein
MAWREKLLDASFRGVKFDVQGTGRSGSRSIVQNEYPYVAGADLEDMNLKPRQFRFKVIIWGDDYEDRLQALIDALEAPGTGELVHPVYGGIVAMAESWEDDHDPDLVDGVTLSISFIEHSTRNVAFAAYANSAQIDAVSTKGDEARAAADDALARYTEGVQDSPQFRLTVFKESFDQAKAALSKLLDTTALKVVLSDLEPVLYPRSYAADLLAVVDRALQGLPFGGRNILFDQLSGADQTEGSGSGDFATAAKTLDPAAVSVAPSAQGADSDMKADAAVVQAHARVHAAVAIADAAVIVLAGELEEALLNRSEIEAIANRARTAIQIAIDSARESLDAEGRGRVASTLGALAYAVLEAARAVINQRPPLVKRDSPLSGPVRLVAFQIYGDASRAPEIVRLNRLGRNVFVERGEELNVYAA